MKDLRTGDSLFFYFSGAKRTSFCKVGGASAWVDVPGAAGVSNVLSKSDDERAGHGGSEPDSTGEEPSGYNQTICPCDCDHEDSITDALIHKMLVKELPMVRSAACTARWAGVAIHACFWVMQACRGTLPASPTHLLPMLYALQNVTLHALIDSCHSGTVMNLPFNAVLKNGKLEGWEEEYVGQSWKKVRVAGGSAASYLWLGMQSG